MFSSVSNPGTCGSPCPLTCQPGFPVAGCCQFGTESFIQNGCAICRCRLNTGSTCTVSSGYINHLVIG